MRIQVQALLCSFIASTAVLSTGCLRKHSPSQEQDPPGVVVPAGKLPVPDDKSGLVPYRGGVIATRVIGGRTFIPVEGTLTDMSFAALSESSVAQSVSKKERLILMESEMSQNLKAIEKSMPVLGVSIVPEVGFFTALIPLDSFERLSQVTGMSHRVLINPTVQSLSTIPASERSKKDAPLGLPVADGRGDFTAFSGLARIRVPEFLEVVKEELGETPDGSKVLVGVTDTGVTLNHPSFFDAQGKSRIVYLKDFTNEGTVYFPETSTLEAREPKSSEVPEGVSADNAVVISARFVIPPTGARVPAADALSEVKEQVFLVSSEIKASILSPNSGIRLGAFSEASFASEDQSELVDLNHNGKTDDLLYVLLLPNQEVKKSRIYIDFTAKGDFRKSPSIGDFNTTGDTIRIFSETPGFSISLTDMIASDGKKSKAVTAAIVGFDPGNHGSHVSGIIAGRKTIANDKDSTLARGVSPNSKLMVDRVCANTGGCQASGAIVDLALNGAEVINMSLGGLSPQNDGYGVQETIINRLTMLKNTVFVISAGNSGPGHQTVGSPSTARLSLSVAATGSRKMMERQHQWPASGKRRHQSDEDHDFLMFFSSRGPTAAGGLKPDISAPGSQLSAIQLNAAEGARPGLDTYWGTSMAAPTAAGAVALLLDAAKRYNEKYPNQALPLDALTIRAVVSESARPFDTFRMDLESKEKTRGQYTWVDQGHGMIHLPNAWKLLKLVRDQKLPSAVSTQQEGVRKDVALDYQVRVLRKNPNGKDYTGADTAPIDSKGGKEPRFGRGIYLDSTSEDSLIDVQIARRLPVSVSDREDLGELTRQLNTTADTFELRTVMFGSHVQWLSAGVLTQLDCKLSPPSAVTIVGPGAVDQPIGSPSSSKGFDASQLNICVDRRAVSLLEPGDHGALIKAYRVVDGQKEAVPSFVIPVYLAVPHSTLSGKSIYQIEKTASSFEVHRHYVSVPPGTSAVKVSIEVPEAQVKGAQVKGCAGVVLMMLEGLNTGVPEELTPRSKGLVKNCESTGAAANGKRVFTYSRLNPRAGLWDALVYGQYQYADSPYKLTVEFAKVDVSLSAITGSQEALNGQLKMEVKESSGGIVPDGGKSRFVISGLTQELKLMIKQDQELVVPSGSGVVFRKYAKDIAKVAIETGGLPGSDLDLVVLECAKEDLAACKSAGASAGATDVEKVSFQPNPEMFYVPVVAGFDVPQGIDQFEFKETKEVSNLEQGSIVIRDEGAGVYTLSHQFDIGKSKILSSDELLGGTWKAVGDITVRDAKQFDLLRIGVKVSKE